MKTAEEKQTTKDARNERRRDRSAEAKALAKKQELMTDVANLLPGDTFTLDEVGYVVLSIDRQSGHIHTHLLEGQENPDTHGSVDFGIVVDVIARAEEAVAIAPATAAPPVTLDMENPAVSGGQRWPSSAPVAPLDMENPAVSGGRWFK